MPDQFPVETHTKSKETENNRTPSERRSIYLNAQSSKLRTIHVYRGAHKQHQSTSARVLGPRFQASVAGTGFPWDPHPLPQSPARERVSAQPEALSPCLSRVVDVLTIWISCLVMVKLEEDHSKQTQDESGARIESYEGREKKGISDVRRTFCLFVTFDLLFITLLWIIELNVKGGIETTLEKEVLQYDYSSSYFDIFLLAVFRFKVLILAYAMCRLRHWWAIAFTTAVTSAFLLAKVIISQLFSQGAFGYVLPIISFILAWIETWFLDFKVLPQEAEEENRFLIAQDASERAALLHPGVLSDGQFYSPPESVAGSCIHIVNDFSY
ncbi:MLN64 N-terminal domain-like protein isoform A [Patagioenas fasciata monilis]|uniref:MLN64 N-terminal domain-like protein isoform A n=1 Tax=Patagioenas fasciata monilis TaxID=372326 RepID=A0A1V4J5F9_PATFA|nr:MLN64 N-terminal domain-like protein isoform A [Patagioenas fasciata monilis]